MEKITFECEVITPMFLAGADGVTPELRAPSIKGALRFWWRALNGHLGLEELKKREDEIFGGTDSRSKFNLKVVPIIEKISPDTFENLNQRQHDLIYMAYGAVNRKFYEIGTKFNIHISSKGESILTELNEAFSMLMHLGALGAKSRNGFGCFQCKNTDSFELIKKYNNFQATIDAPYTSISNTSQIYVSDNSFNNWRSALKELKCLYADSKKNIFPKSDRVYIGAPWKKINEPDRHSKIHLMSLHKDEEGKYRYRISYIPYKYMKHYPDLNDNEIKQHYNKWKKAVKKFNGELDNYKDEYDNYLVNFTFNDNN